MLKPNELRANSVFADAQTRDFYIGASYGRNCKTVNMLAAVDHATVFEFGANPYFMSLMIQDAVNPETHDMANWFGHAYHTENKMIKGLRHGVQQAGATDFEFLHFNVEDIDDPAWDAIGTERYDAVLFCEILEHLLVSPNNLMKRVLSMLKPGGHLIITTPNVFSQRNRQMWEIGQNIYEWYSENGPYGRHNRVWSAGEVILMAHEWGFHVEQMFTHDADLRFAAQPVTDRDDGDTMFFLLRRPQ